MSKASERARQFDDVAKMRQKPLEFTGTIHIRVEEDGGAIVYQNDGWAAMGAGEALSLGRWLIDTFGEVADPPAPVAATTGDR